MIELELARVRHRSHEALRAGDLQRAGIEHRRGRLPHNRLDARAVEREERRREGEPRRMRERKG